MIYVSHLICDEDMKELCCQYGTGVESIEFSISDNLDRLESKNRLYQKGWADGNPPLSPAWAFPGFKPGIF